MSCRNCDNENGERVAYYRWGSANVGLVGCEEHVREVINALNDIQFGKEESGKIN